VTESTCALRVLNLHKEFDLSHDTVKVLEGVSFEAAAGETIVVTGPSGSGKSTLLHIVGTLEPPTSGTVQIDSCSPFGWPEKQLARFRNQTIGFVFQEHHLLPQYSVMENVLLPTMAAPSTSAGTVDRARELLDRVGLSHRVEHRPGQLSGGERQRVAIARALINHPRILLCDEPTGSLDTATAGQVSDVLFDLHEREGMLMLVVTHSLELAARFPRHLRLKEGRCFET
jgi:lipoprotein-releasing system ATP-binding protein